MTTEPHNDHEHSAPSDTAYSDTAPSDTTPAALRDDNLDEVPRGVLGQDRPSRCGSGHRGVVVATGSVLVALVAVLTLILTHHSDATTATGSPLGGPVATATPPGAPTSPTQVPSGPVIPPALHGRPGTEVGVLGLVSPPDSAGCVRMRVAGATPTTYLLTGQWPQSFATSTPRPRTAGPWFLIGHAVPGPISTAVPHHPELAPGACAATATFAVDQAQTIGAWLTLVFQGLFAPLSVPSATATATPPSIHQI
jgi:hypothetical protein